AEVREFLEKLIRATPGLSLDACSKSYVRFFPQAWDVPELSAGSSWTKSGRMLLFEFVNGLNSLRLHLYIGPGPEATRARLFQLAVTKQPPFKPSSKTLLKKWNSVYVRPFLTASTYTDTSVDELGVEIEKHWKHFVDNDLP